MSPPASFNRSFNVVAKYYLFNNGRVVFSSTDNGAVEVRPQCSTTSLPNVETLTLILELENEPIVRVGGELETVNTIL